MSRRCTLHRVVAGCSARVRGHVAAMFSILRSVESGERSADGVATWKHRFGVKVNGIKRDEFRNIQGLITKK